MKRKSKTADDGFNLCHVQTAKEAVDNLNGTWLKISGIFTQRILMKPHSSGFNLPKSDRQDKFYKRDQSQNLSKA
jgi:hypothetical protein